MKAGVLIFPSIAVNNVEKPKENRRFMRYDDGQNTFERH